MKKNQKAKQVHLRLTPEYHIKLKIIAARMGRLTAGEVVQLWIDRYEREEQWPNEQKAR